MLHMIKLAVGCPTLEVLAERMRRERVGGHAVVHTRTMPRRADEILAGGSIYRVMDGMLLCRQPIIGLESCQRGDGSTGTLIVVSDEIIPVQPRAMRPFQGWRYMTPKDAPADLGENGVGDGIADLPPALRRELAELALI
ncbi:DUF1489 family protein [Gluconobacter wancherniae]|uniref:Lysophospholipase n=1 Tax=Gluconobacter wancherniae NBRC 103581 TaxID=656744 RepID=A0A511AW98_9PROT|nr:DUF1489 domain-containing protein [Gluconobacter wancherniae]MBF0852661.1 DUF1489 family protein [Gluconobacter wancherniae]MBS1087549.1 DUF1489 domain-containing protein [Gluconobacter wancherniae]MBS1093231.1 DUF1489 domain-containing protein [Gluconobacter wancherniae]GBD56627.1 lysophospholipase [Gluconobacter wancherniae NBRC 103581]GBR64236.1 hypothetical protein AA103581_1216 [Gluconobacter wancherniae NBRC 103581]